jgi:hypothetical protein
MVKARLNGNLKTDDRVSEDIYLQLPEAVAQQARKEAKRLLSPATSSREQTIERLKEFFRNRQLVYATDNLPITDNPVDTFLFETKRGYCEYFASSFAIMLREAGVPARLVGGYLGGVYNPLGGYYIVGEKHAHVWVEALTEEGVWQRIDPNLYAVNADSSLLARSLQQRPGWQQWADAIDYFWTQAVITFDFARQVEFARSARDKVREWRKGEISWRDKTWIALVLVVPALLLFLRKHERLSTEEKLMKSFTRIVKQKIGTTKIPPSAGLHELARRTPGRQAKEFVRIYSDAVYRDRELNKDEIEKLQILLKTMRKSPD